MRKVFISYARQNKRDIDQLVEHLRVLGCDTWVDSSLHGGQDWWEEILRRIADCETFIAIISREALSSTACKREFDWAEALGKPVLPVAVESPPRALPRRFSMRQIVDYSEPEDRDRAALTLAGGLATLSAAPPLPDPLPKPPAAPLSYLTDLIELVSQPDALDHDQQRHILSQLEPALRSVDREERRGGRDIFELLSSRDDLYADVDRTIMRLRSIGDVPASVRSDDQGTTQGPSTARAAELSASTHDTVLGDDVRSRAKTTRERGLKEERTNIDEHLGAHPSRGDGTDLAQSTPAALPADVPSETAPSPDAPAEVMPSAKRAVEPGAVSEVSRAPTSPTKEPDQSRASAAVLPPRGSGTHADLTSTSGASGGEQTTQGGMAARNRRTMIVLAVGLAFVVVAAAVVWIATRSDPTQQLLALAGGDNCSPADEKIHPGVVANVSCEEGALPTGGVDYYLFSEQAALDSYYNGLPFSPQPCPGMGQSPQNWHRTANPQHTEGKVGCFVTQDGTPTVSWTVDSQLVFGYAYGPKGGTIQQVYQWWAARYGGGQV